MKVFNIKFDNLDMKEVLEKIERFLKSNKQHFIVLPYSEFIVRAQKDKEFRNILNQADLCLCEGRGLYFALRFLGFSIKKEINGIELIHRLNHESGIRNYELFLLGGEEDIVKKAADRLGDCVIGYEHGYQNSDKAVEKINKVKPNILLVGLGSPKQEKFIYYNLDKMPSVKLAIGVGGAFDFISGKIKRAPKVIQKIGFEWLWRLILQPRRIRRITRGILGLIFLFFKNMVLLENKGRNNNSKFKINN